MPGHLGAALIYCILAAGRAAAAPAPLPEEFTNPDTPERELYRTAGRLFEQGSYPAAAKNYRDFVDKYPNHPRAPLAQAMLAESLYRQAVADAQASDSVNEKVFRDPGSEYSKALSRAPKGDNISAGAAYRLGEIEFNLKRYPAAVEAMRRVKAEHPGDLLRGEATLLEAQALLAMKRAPEAHALLKALLKDQGIYETEPRLALAYGVALFDVGNSSDALRYLERIELPLAHLYAARANLALGKPLVAVERLRKCIEADPQGPLVELARYLSAEAFFHSKDYASAIQAYEDFLRGYPRSPYRPGAVYKIGLCQYERGDYLAARGSFQAVLQLSPNNEFAELALFMTAETYMKENRLKEANLAYAEMAATFQTPLAGTAMLKQGLTHYKQGELPAAEAALKAMMLKYPDHELAPVASLLIGNVLTSHQLYGDAVRAYQRCLDMLESSKLDEEKRTELREVALALLSRANLLGFDHGSLVSGYQYLLKHVKPTLNPWRAMAMLYIGEGYYRQGHYDQALAIYKDVLKSFPAAPESAYAADGVAWCLFAKGQYAQTEAERVKLMAYQKRPDVAPAKTVLSAGRVGSGLFIQNGFEIAAALFNQKKYLEALDAYEGLEKANPDHDLAPEAALQAGWCYYRLEHYGQALKAWERVEGTYAAKPAAAKAAWAIADTYFRAGQYDKAVATYQRILQAYPQDAPVSYVKLRIAQSYYNARDLLKAIGAFEALLLEFPDMPEAPQVLDFVSQLLFQPQAKAEALASLNRVADAKPDTALAAQARFRVARFHFETGDYASAVEVLEKLIVRITGQGELMDAQYYLAESYYQLKRFSEAASAYERFTLNFPGEKRFPAALFHLGAARFKIDDHPGAAEAFSRLAKDYPQSNFAPVALFNSALAYRKIGKWEEAALALKTYLKEHPEEAKSSNAMSELASLYEEHRQFGPAVESLEEQRKALPPDDSRRVELTLRLAEAQAALGDDAKAEVEYQAAARSPLRSNPFRLQALAKLGELYEKSEKWGEAYDAYMELARSAAQKEWVEAAKARAQLAREKMASAAPQGNKAGAGSAQPQAPAKQQSPTEMKEGPGAKPAPAKKAAPKPAAPKPAPKKDKETKKP